MRIETVIPNKFDPATGVNKNSCGAKAPPLATCPTEVSPHKKATKKHRKSFKDFRATLFHTHTACGVFRCEPRCRDETPGEPGRNPDVL